MARGKKFKLTHYHNSMMDLSGCDAIVKQFSDAFQRIYERDK
jgi:hypothetical protein